MASGEHLKALLRSHIKGDDSHFLAVAMQMAAHEAKQGHGKLAEDLRTLIDSAQSKRKQMPSAQPVPIGQPRGELSNLLSVALSQTRFSEMILDDATHGRLARIINEQRNFEKIRARSVSSPQIAFGRPAGHRQNNDGIGSRWRIGNSAIHRSPR